MNTNCSVIMPKSELGLAQQYFDKLYLNNLFIDLHINVYGMYITNVYIEI